MRTTVRAALATAALSLILSACGPEPVPEPLEVPTNEAPGAVVDQDQLDGILAAVMETLVAADAAAEAEQLGGRVTGPARAMREAEYELARTSEGDYTVTPLVTDAQVAVVGATSQWPRVVQVVTTIPEGANLPRLITLVQADPRADYELWSWVRLLPGTEMPATVNPATGSPVVPADSDTLLASPQEVIERYVDVINDEESEHAGSFADDELRDLFSRELASLSEGAAEAGTVEQSVAVSEHGTYALGTNDGGAIVVGAIERDVTFTRTIEGSTLQVGSNIALGGATEVEGSHTATYLVALAFHVPAAGGDGQVELLGTERILVGVTRDDSVSPD
ncbi:MAG: hypothetical protein ACQERF_03475 [Actinomycetota bacterium]